MTGIYGILNLLNNKIYVGQAVNIQKRWKNHRIELQLDRHCNEYLQSAYNKNGRFAFIWYVLEYCELEKLTEREQHWMNFYKSYDREFGYNLSCIAGGSLTGYKHKPETIEAWSKQRKGKIRGPEARAAIKAGWEKRKANGPVSEETKRKLSESHKDKKHTEEFKEAARKRMIGNTINSGRKQSTEEILDRAIKRTGKKRTPEQLVNIAEGKRKAARRREKDLMWTW